MSLSDGRQSSFKLSLITQLHVSDDKTLSPSGYNFSLNPSD